MSVKMIDIARKAGVTRQAVSAVLNHPDTCRISSAMQEKIRQIASEMGYSPNIAARILKGANSSTIGVIDSNLQFGVTATRFREIILQLRDRRLNAILKVVQAPDVVPESSIKEFEMRGVDGILFNSVSDLPDMRSRKVPYVVLGQPSNPLSDFYFDHFKGGVIAVEHLYWHGRRKIAMLAHKQTFFTEPDSRAEGWRYACRNCGIECGENLQFFGEKFNWDFDDLLVLIKKEKVDAIICQNDYVGGKLISELLRRNVRVPDDVAVIGYDGMSFCEFCAIPMATVIQPVRDFARMEVELLCERIKDGCCSPEPRKIAIEPILCPSASCGCSSDSVEKSFLKLNYLQTIEMSHFVNFDEPFMPGK